MVTSRSSNNGLQRKITFSYVLHKVFSSIHPPLLSTYLLVSKTVVLADDRCKSIEVNYLVRRGKP